MPPIDEGTKAVIELTAERAAKAAIREHIASCPIAAAYKATRAQQRWIKAVALTSVSALAAAVVALAKAVSGGH